MFIFPVGMVLDELASYAPEILEPLKSQGAKAYPELAKISIDYALMEKTTSAYVIPANFPWDDLGDWNALERLLDNDSEGNLVIGNHVSQETQSSIIYNNEPEEIIMTIGVEDLVIVRQGNATLVVHKNKTQDIKKALQILRKQQDSQKFL
jgi:mannose-1-phosphate guanylyltransferase